MQFFISVTATSKRFLQAYGKALLLAIMLHVILLIAIQQTHVTRQVKLPVAEAVISYLYQPPLPVQQNEQPLSPPERNNDAEPTKMARVPALSELKQMVVNSNPAQAKPPSVAADVAHSPSTDKSERAQQTGLAQRALDRAGRTDSALIDQAATAAYSQLLQAQQQPKITVEKRYQELSTDPAKQVIAQLDNGQQLVRVKGGCRIVDPAKQGFDALMAVRAVPCGDEEGTSALLKQALEKHSKR